MQLTMSVSYVQLQRLEFSMQASRVFTAPLIAGLALGIAGCSSTPERLPTASPPPSIAQTNVEPNTVECWLKRGASNDYAGSCAIPCFVNELAINIDGPRKDFVCDKPTRTVPVTLSSSVSGTRQWLGTMTGRQPEDPTRFEIGTVQGQQTAKTPYGWFALTSAQQSSDTLNLRISANKQLPPTTDDIDIIKRAIALVSSVEVWNKNDDRNCPPNPTKWSVFCAMMQATEEKSGGVHYRQPAMQAVREVVNEVGGNRVGKHRLMDYNNHPETTLADIHNLLKMAQQKLEKRLK
jgi:hypothetical protein